MKKNVIKQPYLLHGKIRNYDWGGDRFITQVLGIPQPPNTPYAEYWLGAHPQAPSYITLDNNNALSLPEMLQSYPVYFTQNTQQFPQYEFPFLLKILDVKNMLSIQIHPNLKQAHTGFENETQQNIPIDSTLRVFKDKNHKPEMMIALSDFWLIHGFATSNMIKNRLLKYKSLEFIAKDFITNGLENAFKKLMRLPKNTQTFMIQNFLNELETTYTDKKSPEYWIKKYTTHATHQLLNDIGIISILFFNIVQLGYKDAIFQAPGIPHAYLEGQNIEIMTNSDNVIRGGLTVKHIDINLFLSHLNFAEVNPQIYHPHKNEPGVIDYSFQECQEFGIHWITLETAQTIHCNSNRVEILLCIQGAFKLDYFLNEGIQSIQAKKGVSILIPTGFEYQLTAIEPSIIVKAF